LGYTKWPVTPAPSINEVQWIQYQLDTRASVADLVAHIDDVRIVSAFAKIHYFVCDATGACATIEGRGDHVEVHTGVDMALAALTNDPYSSSVAYAKTFLNQTPPCSSVPTTSDSLARFARAACTSFTTVPGETVIAEAARVNATLDSVAQGTYSKWHVVYDLTAKTISVRTLDAPVAKTVSLGSFDFSCTKSVKILDLNAVFTAPADVSSQFVPYTTAANRSIVERSLLNGFAHMPADVVEKIATFPETMACVAP
jgi:penicillin V acylase-like amidase (Ntn superfamily)